MQCRTATAADARPGPRRRAERRRPTCAPPQTRFAVSRIRRRPARAAVCVMSRWRRRKPSQRSTPNIEAGDADQRHHGDAGGYDRAPLARGQQRDGHDQRELRFIGEQAKQHAGEQRAGRADASSAAPNSPAVRKPFWPCPRLIKTAGKPAATGSHVRTDRDSPPAHPADDDADHGEVQREAADLPDGQRQRVAAATRAGSPATGRSADTASRNRAWPRRRYCCSRA